MINFGGILLPFIECVIIGALSIRVLLRWFNFRPRKGDYLRGGLTWSLAYIATLIFGVLIDVNGPFPRAVLGATFGVVGGSLSIWSLKRARVPLSRKAKQWSIAAWGIGFSVAAVGNYMGTLRFFLMEIDFKYSSTMMALTSLAGASGVAAIVIIEGRRRIVEGSK
jgi:hypothetical protein